MGAKISDAFATNNSKIVTDVASQGILRVANGRPGPAGPPSIYGK